MKNSTKWRFVRAGLYVRRVDGILECVHRNPGYWNGWRWYRGNGFGGLARSPDGVYKTATAAMLAHSDGCTTPTSRDVGLDSTLN